MVKSICKIFYVHVKKYQILSENKLCNRYETDEKLYNNFDFKDKFSNPHKKYFMLKSEKNIKFNRKNKFRNLDGKTSEHFV